MSPLPPDTLRRIAIVAAALVTFAIVLGVLFAVGADPVALPAASVIGLLVAALGTRAEDRRQAATKRLS
jgi:hypothetical protein